MMKKLIAMALAAVMAMSMVACGGDAEETTTAAPAETTAAAAGETTAAASEDPYANLPEVELTVGSSAASSNIGYTFMVDAAKAVEEKTGGKLKINVVWDGTLGNDGELIESCMGGNVDMISLASSPLLSYVPEIAVFDMPMVFESMEQAWEGLATFADSFQPIMNEKGMQLLSMNFQKFRGLSTNVNIQSPADIEGMSIRIMENKYHQLFWENLGAKPTPLAFSELYLALQQGLVDAQDNPIAAIYTTKFHEVQDYFMKITAFPFVSFGLINKETYDSLPAEYQVLLEEFFLEYDVNTYEYSEQEEADAIAAMADACTELPYTEEIIAALKAAAEPVWEQIKADIGAEMPDALIAAAEAAK